LRPVHTQVPPSWGFDLIEVGADLRVRPGQRLPMQTSDAHPCHLMLWTGSDRLFQGVQVRLSVSLPTLGGDRLTSGGGIAWFLALAYGIVIGG